MELWTPSPLRILLLFDNSREVVLNVYNPISAAEPTVPELGMLFILGAAVYITFPKRTIAHRVIHHPRGGTIVKCRHRRLMPSLISTNRRCGYGYGQHCPKLAARKAGV
jgi:hypothetical protein